MSTEQARREGERRGISYPGPRDTKMRPFEKTNSKKFFPEGPRENVSPGPAVALNGPEPESYVRYPVVRHFKLSASWTLPDAV